MVFGKMSITYCIEKAFEAKKRKGWDVTYWAIDLHETICPGSYKVQEEDHKEFYPGALPTLQLLTRIDNIKLILYSCSYRSYLKQYEEWFEKNDIKFDLINESPEPNNELSNFDNKIYFNVLLDDKAGFNPHEDWIEVNDALCKCLAENESKENLEKWFS
jgi:hypothetical protein